MPGPGGHPSVDRPAPEAAASPGGASAALAAARGQFLAEPGVVYLDSATYGLPPLPTVRALHQAVEPVRGVPFTDHHLATVHSDHLYSRPEGRQIGLIHGGEDRDRPEGGHVELLANHTVTSL